jgi:uncharacterized protein YndB with AHSA1/START domain
MTMPRRETASAHIDASPTVVFDLLTDLSRLPEWNHAITEVVAVPAQLSAGAVWKVRLHALGQTWVSTSRVDQFDPEARRFSYRSQTDDGNPSYADWVWLVEDDADGCNVVVSVVLEPMTFWRKHLFVKIRRPALRREMEGSLDALRAALRGS